MRRATSTRSTNAAEARRTFGVEAALLPLTGDRMLHQWNIRSRAHHCAVTERPFEDGEKHYTAIYFDPKAGEYTRRDVSLDAWEQELSERKPFSFWKSIYEKTAPGGKAEIAPKEDALTMLQRLIEEGNPYTENARYILAAMLERKRVLAPKDRKETEEGIMLIYENKKTGEIYIVRDPELRLDEVASVQDEVATLLGFGGPAAEAAKVAGVEIGPDGKVKRKDKKKGEEPKKEESAAATTALTTTETTTEVITAETTTTKPDATSSSSESLESFPSSDEQDTKDEQDSNDEEGTEEFDEEDDLEDEEEDDLEEEEDEDLSDEEDLDEGEESDEAESVAVEEEDDEDLDEADEEDASETDGESVLIEEDAEEEDEEEEDDFDDEDEEEEADEDEGESVMIEEEPEEEDAK